jgi:ABC-type glycerol-3-phosphate transport system substrate-binding protein
MWVDSISYHAAAPLLPFMAGVVQLPTGTSVSTEFDILAFDISSHSAVPEGCWEWISYLSAEPQVVTMLPARRSVALWWQARVEKSARPAYLTTLEFADTPIFRQRWEIPWLAAAFQAVVGGQDAQAALTDAQARAERLISCAGASGGSAGREQLRACARGRPGVSVTRVGQLDRRQVAVQARAA